MVFRARDHYLRLTRPLADRCLTGPLTASAGHECNEHVEMTKNSANETTAKTQPPANGQGPDDLSAYQITNPQEFAENMFRLVEESGKAMTQMWLHSPDQSGPMSATHELVEASRTMTEPVLVSSPVPVSPPEQTPPPKPPILLL